MQEANKLKLFNRYFILVWLASFGLNLTQNILNNSVSLYITSLEMSTGFAGFLGIPYAICAILMRFLGGCWADKHSRRSLLVFGCVGFGVTAFLFGWIPVAASLICFRALHGFCFSAGQLAGSTINVDVTPKEKSSAGIGFFWVASAISFGIAGYLVTALTKGGSYRPVFLVCTASALAAGLFSLLCRYEKKGLIASDEERADSLEERYTGIQRFVEPKAAKPAILMFLMAVANSSATLYLLLFAQSAGYSNAGFALLLAAVGMAFGNLGSDKFVGKIGARNILMISYAVCGAAYISMGLVHSVFTYMLGGIACGYIQGICMPVLYYLSVQHMPVYRRGVAGGTVYFMLDLGVGVGSWLWGVVIATGGFGMTFVISGTVFLLGAIASILFYRRIAVKEA